MKTKSAKAKGRRLQNEVRDKLISKFPKLREDITSQIMGMRGEDIVLSPAAKQEIPYSFECKNTEKVNIWQALEQAISNCGSRKPVLVIKRNRSKTYAIIELDDFIEII